MTVKSLNVITIAPITIAPIVALATGTATQSNAIRNLCELQARQRKSKIFFVVFSHMMNTECENYTLPDARVVLMEHWNMCDACNDIFRRTNCHFGCPALVQVHIFRRRIIWWQERNLQLHKTFIRVYLYAFITSRYYVWLRERTLLEAVCARHRSSWHRQGRTDFIFT